MINFLIGMSVGAMWGLILEVCMVDGDDNQ